MIYVSCFNLDESYLAVVERILARHEQPRCSPRRVGRSSDPTPYQRACRRLGLLLRALRVAGTPDPARPLSARPPARRRRTLPAVTGGAFFHCRKVDGRNLP